MSARSARSNAPPSEPSRAPKTLRSVVADAEEGCCVLGRRCALCVGERRSRKIGDVDRAGAGCDACGDPAVALGERDHRHAPRTANAIGRDRVGGEAHVGLRALFDQDHAAGATRRGKGRLDDSVSWFEPRGVVAHRPPSVRALSTFTFRTSADGAPWLTGATWPGWPFPQLNAPQSRYVERPPTASIEPQKSVVVAW